MSLPSGFGNSSGTTTTVQDTRNMLLIKGLVYKKDSEDGKLTIDNLSTSTTNTPALADSTSSSSTTETEQTESASNNQSATNDSKPDTNDNKKPGLLEGAINGIKHIFTGKGTLSNDYRTVTKFGRGDEGESIGQWINKTLTNSHICLAVESIW